MLNVVYNEQGSNRDRHFDARPPVWHSTMTEQDTSNMHFNGLISPIRPHVTISYDYDGLVSSPLSHQEEYYTHE